MKPAFQDIFNWLFSWQVQGSVIRYVKLASQLSKYRQEQEGFMIMSIRLFFEVYMRMILSQLSIEFLRHLDQKSFLHFVFSSLVPLVRRTKTVRVSRNDNPRDWVPTEKPELVPADPLELTADEADPPPPQRVKIRSATDPGTPSPKTSRMKSCRLT